MTDRAIVEQIAAARAFEAAQLVKTVIGMTEVKARRLINKHGCQSRVIKPGALYTADVRFDRICLYLKDDIVERAEIG